MKLALDRKKIAVCRKIAVQVSKDVRTMIDSHSTVATERSVLRLMGIEGAKHIPANNQHYPLVNVVIDQLQQDQALPKGASFWMANACLALGKTPIEIASAVANGEVQLS